MSESIAIVDRTRIVGSMIHLNSKEEFYNACDLMHSGSFYAAYKRFTSLVENAGENRSLRKSGLWARAKCHQRMALVAKTLEETISLQRAALADRADAIAADPLWFAHEMLGHQWYPQHPAYLPAYLVMLTSKSVSVKWAAPQFVEAIGEMGPDADDVVPMLQAALEKWPEVTQIEAAIERITKPVSPITGIPIDRKLCPLSELVAEALMAYPGRDGSNVGPPVSIDDILLLPERDLCRLLSGEQEKARELAACVLRFVSEEPEPSTITRLMHHAGPEEERARVRGQSLLTLTRYASTKALHGQDLERLMVLLQERLLCDVAASVQSIAAECLARIGTNRVDAVSSLVSKLKVTKNPNLTWTLVRVVAEIGHAAREALPRVLSVSPRLGNAIDDVIQATAILYMAAEESREHDHALATILAAVRWQPTNKPTALSRERRRVALNTICEAPINETFRCRFLLERFFLDEAAALRRVAARKLVSLDDGLARSSGADQFMATPHGSVC